MRPSGRLTNLAAELRIRRMVPRWVHNLATELLIRRTVQAPKVDVYVQPGARVIAGAFTNSLTRRSWLPVTIL